MTMLVFGLYNSSNDAQETIDHLKDEGFNRSDIELIEHSDKKEDQGFFKRVFSSDGGGEDLDPDDLSEMGLSRADADFYTQAVKDGCSLLIVQCEDDDTGHARQILANSNLSDYGIPPSRREEASAHTSHERESSLSHPSPSREEPADEGTVTPMAERDDLETSLQSRETRESEAYAGSEVSGESEQTDKIQAVEEELHVGKRKVESGGVRVSTEVSEEDVEEQVELKREELDVQRRDVDRPAEAHEGTFQEETYEFTETREEPVVEKQARVKEEVIVDRDVQTTTETIRENLRRQNIKIEDLYSMAGEDSGRYEQFESDIRSHYDQHYATEAGVSDEQFDEYSVGYRYGMSLAEHEPFRQHTWEEIEPLAREGWESHNAGTWEDFREPIYFGWIRIRGDEGRELPRQQI